MAPRQPLPDDDLYRRLGVPTDAALEAIEVAWRALLRRHHPDVAGPDSTELARRINVAHDWLSDPALRARYDRERGLRHAVGPRDSGPDRSVRRTAGDATSRRPRDWASTGRHPRQAPRESPLERFVRQVAALSPTEIDRLSLAEPQPIAFTATIRRFVPAERLTALDALGSRVAAVLPPAARRPLIRDAIDGYATELVLGPALDELLSEPFRGRTRERLTRGWDSAVGQPRYGPNGAEVSALLERIRGLDRAGVRELAASVPWARDAAPWPLGVSAEEDDALRVSAGLAARDAALAVPGGVDAATRSQARRAACRPAHLLVLSHAFPAAAFAGLTRPWRPWLLPADAARPGTAPKAGFRRPATNA